MLCPYKTKRGNNTSSDAILWPEQSGIISLSRKTVKFCSAFHLRIMTLSLLKLLKIVLIFFFLYLFLRSTRHQKNPWSICCWSFELLHFSLNQTPNQKHYFLSPPTKTENLLEYVKTIDATVAFLFCQNYSEGQSPLKSQPSSCTHNSCPGNNSVFSGRIKY